MRVDPLEFPVISPDASDRGASSGEDFDPKPVGYYGEPVLKKPSWGWSVVTYLFLGGIMGGSAILLALVDERSEGERKLARNARYLSLGLAAACPALLISHLGRPERFLNMLRIVKFRSPMSMGVWGLVAFSNVAVVAVIAQGARDGILPRWLSHLAPRWLTNSSQALLGSFIAGYTGVLLSATAVPLWAKGKRHIPALSVCSSVAGACAANAALLALSGGDTGRTRRRLERLELVAGAAELGLLIHFQQHAGDYGKPMFEGPRGQRLKTATMAAGIVAPALLNVIPGHGRWKTLLGSTLTLAGGYILRETLIEAGKMSADDPKAAFRQPE